ncbi:MAG TPA: mucoidy inhibitor MuiA family protein [Ktedonobacterales bacterium]
MEVQLDAPIREVTVYPDQALVVRRGKVMLTEAGESAITLGGLTRELDAQSVRAAAKATAAARLLSVDMSQEFNPSAPEELLARLRAEIDGLERDVAALGQRLSLIRKQRAWLDTLGEQSARSLAYGMTRGTAQADDATRVFGFTRDEQERLNMLALDIRRERKGRVEQLEAKKRELGAAGAAKSADRLRAVIRVAADAPCEMTVEMSYLVRAASWSPRYDARVDVAASRLRLTQQAQVAQYSEEDWQGVSLSLSTARPSAAVTLPDEAPVWYIDQVKPAPSAPPHVFAAQAAPMRAMSRAAAPDLIQKLESFGSATDGADVDFEAAVVEIAGAAQVFRAGDGVDIPSDGQPHTVGLGDADAPVTLEYVVAPVVVDGAHLRATARNTTGHTLPAGALHAFQVGPSGDEYVGRTRLERVAEDAPLKLFLGVNDNITVKRELVERDVDKGNLLQGGVRKTTLGYRITIANRTQTPQRMIVLDRLPLARHERIKVRVLEMRPQPGAQSKLDQLTWSLTLGPGDERTVEWRALVESPADMEISGLP